MAGEIDESALADYRAIGEEGGADALALVGHLMQKSAESNARLMDELYEGMEAERDRWKERALAAESQLDTVHMRLRRLVYAEYGSYPGEEILP